MTKKSKCEPASDLPAEDTITPDEISAAEQENNAEAEVNPLQAALEAAQLALAAKEDQCLRLAAEYDNFRKRTQKEMERSYGDAKMETVKAFLPVYDNLSRALNQETSDAAYAKGVEMTMTGVKGILEKLGVTEIPALGATFDPTLHNAVMHVDDESIAENTIVEVFEPGFMLGEKVIRFSMVKVAN